MSGRRVSLAIAAAIAVHVAIAACVLRLSVRHARGPRPAVALVPVTIGESPAQVTRQVDSTASPGSKAAGRPQVVTPVRRRLPAQSAHRRGGAPSPPPRAPGPDGAGLTVLLRLERLRTCPGGADYLGPIDDLLRTLPDRRRLLEGSGLDLYRDFDTLLIVTPMPFDEARTFLAVRHHLSDDVLRAGLERSAPAGGRRMEWNTLAGGTVGVRANLPGTTVGGDDDDRRVALLGEGLAVVAPPDEVRSLLEGPAANAALGALEEAAGAVSREAIFLMTATDLSAIPAVPAAAAPQVITLAAGAAPTPYLALTATFASDSDARAWEIEWRSWRHGLSGHPIPWVAALAPVLVRAAVSRENRGVALRVTATPGETRRLLQLLANAAHAR
jgi:hypothetical protein